MFEQAVAGLLAMGNLDFGVDWGNSAVNNYKNGHYILGTMQLVNGMGEAAIDLVAAYFGASVVGASASAIGTAITEKSITAGYVDFEFKLNGYLRNLGNSISNTYNNAKNTFSKIFNQLGNKNNTISFPSNDSQLKHIFRDAPGHINDTKSNRKLILNVANKKENYLGTDKRGNDWYQNLTSDGKQVWVRVRNGIIDNAGVNEIPREFDIETGLYNNLRR